MVSGQGRGAITSFLEATGHPAKRRPQGLNPYADYPLTFKYHLSASTLGFVDLNLNTPCLLPLFPSVIPRSVTSADWEIHHRLDAGFPSALHCRHRASPLALSGDAEQADSLAAPGNFGIRDS